MPVGNLELRNWLGNPRWVGAVGTAGKSGSRRGSVQHPGHMLHMLFSSLPTGRRQQVLVCALPGSHTSLFQPPRNEWLD